MSKEKERDYLCLFRSKFDVMLKLSDVGLREITQAMFDFLEGKDPVFSDMQAQALWWTWSLEFNTAKENYKIKCKKNKQRARERWEKNKVGIENIPTHANACTGIKNMPTHANACQRIPTHANACTGIENMPTHTNDAYTETETDTDTDTETENIVIENNNIKGTPTLDDVLKFAKDPSVALSQEEARKFYDHYTAQSWLRSNGQQIPNTATALVCALRIWKSNSGKFDVSPTSPPRPKKPTREEIAEQINSNKKLFNELFWLKEGRNRGDYDSDPKTFHKWYLKDVVLDAIESPEFSKTKTTYNKYKEQ